VTLRACVATVVAGIAVGTATGAPGATAPKLEPAAVRAIALRALEFVAPGAAFEPDPRLTVEQTKATHNGRTVLWVVHVHGTVPVFPCRLPAIGAGAPSCIPPAGATQSDDALVTVADATARVFSVRPADAQGHPLTN
jgi:hypothetical protein